VIKFNRSNIDSLANIVEKRPWAVALTVSLLALMIRAWHLVEMEANDPFFYHPIVDPEFYHLWAIRISEGEFDSDAVFFLSPLYPYFLGFIYWLTEPGMIIPRIVQIVLGALSVAGIFFIGRRVFGALTGLASALIYAFYAPAIFYEPLYLVSAIQTPLNVALVLALLVTFDKPGRYLSWLGCGVLLGLSALARPNVLLFGGFVIAGLLLQIQSRPDWRQAIIRGFVFAVGVGIIIFPVTIRNYAAEQDFVLVTSSGGLNFYIGNNAGATGRFQTPRIFGGAEVSAPRGQLDAYTKFAEAEAGRPLSTSQASDYWYQKAWSEISADPGRWVQLLTLKLSLFFNYYEIGNSRNFTQSVQFSSPLQLPLFRFGLIAPFALTGMLLGLRRWRQALLLYGMVSVYVVTALMFFVLAHYRIPVTPFLTLFAAHCGVWMIKAVRERQWFKSILVIWALSGFGFWTHLYLTNPAPDVENNHYNLGNVYAKQERYDDAIREYRQSIAMNPNKLSRHHNLAYVSGLRPETYQEAIEAWQTVESMGIERGDEYHVQAARQEISRIRNAIQHRN
jgi:tetratricopeptide (TPR) repeat protein